MKRTIVVVDDSQIIRDVTGFTLEANNFDVLYAADGQEALSFFDGRRIDLLITDLYMPEMNGHTLIKKVREIDNYKTLPILMVTTESNFAQKQQAKTAGATGWIVKPFVPEKLLAAINKVIR